MGRRQTIDAMLREDGRRDEALCRFAILIEVAASRDAALVAVAIATTHIAEDNRVDLVDMLQAAGFGSNRRAAAERLRLANNDFEEAFGFSLVLRDPSWFDRLDGEAETDGTIGVSERFTAVVEEAPPSAPHAEIAPQVDAATLRWLGAIRVAAGAGESLHLCLRCRRRDQREMDDLAALLRRSGVPVIRVGAEAKNLTATLLGIELHAEPGTVVVIGAGHLARTEGDPESIDEPGGGLKVSPSAFAVETSSWLGAMRRVHVWCIPADGRLEAAFDGFIGGCIGPMVYDAAWAHALVAGMLPGVGDVGASALTTGVGDPRDATAIAAAARHLARGGRIGLDEACAVVARSVGGDGSANAGTAFPADFDPRLLVCDEDALTLLDRAEAAARNGARVLAHGAPGGGKSTYGQALAARIADAMRPRGQVVVVTPAAILAKPYGATERLMEALWARAAGSGQGPAGVLLIDELDAMCGVRDPGGASGGNAYLVRVLTDQWLRCFDLHPDVPVVATVNDRKAVDTAVLRRFHLVLEFGDELSPEAERLAWTTILKMEPPPGWRACGAAVADFASAITWARIIGAMDPISLRSAVARARTVRCGSRPSRHARTGLH